MPSRPLALLLALALAPFALLHGDLAAPRSALAQRAAPLGRVVFEGVSFDLGDADGARVAAVASSLRVESVGRLGTDKALVARDVVLHATEGPWFVERLELDGAASPWRWSGTLRRPGDDDAVPQRVGWLRLDGGRLELGRAPR